MDYTKASLAFKLRKTFRYIGLYGLERTIVKIKGQYHMKSVLDFSGSKWENPVCDKRESPDRGVAIVGCGNFAFSNIAYYLSKSNSRFLRATFDVNRSRSRSLCKAYGGDYAAAQYSTILDDPKVRTIFIASNHSTHAEYAIAAIEAGKDVHIEKPHVVTEEQLGRLMSTKRENPRAKVFLGFNRPRSSLFVDLKRELERESGPLMINWFIAGHEIADDHWYFNAEEGGRVLGNLCHWTDLTLHLVTLEKAFPCTIVPASPEGSKSDFVVSAIFADGSCASITFSAKGHTFEGVREILNIHKGNLLANLTDFQSLRVDLIDKKRSRRLRHRDHGHRVNIINSITKSNKIDAEGESERYIWSTAAFFLAIRRAIEDGQKIVLNEEQISHASPVGA